MNYCEHCGGTIAENARYCEECYYGSSLLLPQIEVILRGDPEPENYMGEECDHEYRELGNGMAQCIYCGVIED